MTASSVVDDPSTMMDLDHTEFALFYTKRLQSDLEAIGIQIKQHENNLRFLISQKTKLDESIIDLHVHMNKLHLSATNLQGEDINEQISQNEDSSDRFVCHGTKASRFLLTKRVVGIVAKLGKVLRHSLSCCFFRCSETIESLSDDELKVRFAKPSGSREMENNCKTEKQMKELKWKKEKVVEDIKREQVLRDQAMFSFGKKKEELVRFLKQFINDESRTSKDAWSSEKSKQDSFRSKSLS